MMSAMSKPIDKPLAAGRVPLAPAPFPLISATIDNVPSAELETLIQMEIERVRVRCAAYAVAFDIASSDAAPLGVSLEILDAVDRALVRLEDAHHRLEIVAFEIETRRPQDGDEGLPLGICVLATSTRSTIGGAVHDARTPEQALTDRAPHTLASLGGLSRLGSLLEGGMGTAIVQICEEG